MPAETSPAAETPPADATARLAVIDWRRQVHALYAAVRAEPDPATAHARWVSGRSELFLSHPASARMAGQRLRHAPYDAALRFELVLEPAPPHRLEVPTGTDGVVVFERLGRFSLDGVLPAGGGLDAWYLSGYGNGLFVPLRDATAGSLTYGAGRYLLDTVKGADLGRTPTAAGSPAAGSPGERWVLDFNFSYNPSCVYDPAWACPLAPEGNRLLDPLPVGELLPEGY